MNLLWLKYVSYLFSAGAALCFLGLRLRTTRFRRGVGFTLYGACLVLACIFYNVARVNVFRHSPRVLVMGEVVSVQASSGRSHRISDEFHLRLGRGFLSPTFSTDIVAENISGQPIHQGDVLGVLYRTWDGEPLTIDVLQGQHPGWHYRTRDTGGISVAGFVFIGLIGLLSVFTAKDDSGGAKPMPDDSVSLHLNDA